MEELNTKNRENEVLKNRILMFRQQLKFKVSRLRQFQGMPPQGSESPKDSDSSHKDLEIQKLKQQIQDRDQLISEQVSAFPLRLILFS